MARKKQSLLARAAAQSSVLRARNMLCDALALSRDSAHAAAHLDTRLPHRWAAFSTAGRLRMLSDWLAAECRELMQLQAGRLPKNTVGTND